MHLKGFHFVAYTRWLQHAYGSFLEGHIATTVKVGTARSNSLDEFLGSNDPGYTPSWKTEALGQSVKDENIILVDVFNVVGSGDDGAVAVGRVIVTAIELVHDQCRTITADVLNLSEFRVGDHLACGVTGVGRKDD